MIKERVKMINNFVHFLMQLFNEESDAANLGAIYSVLLTFQLILSNMSFFSSHRTELLGCSIVDKMSSTVKPRKNYMLTL